MAKRACLSCCHFRLRPIISALLVIGATPLAHAANWSGSTGVSLGETYSDNIGRQPSGRTRSDWATEVSPWLSYAGRGARTSGALDARLQNWLHTDSQTSNRTGLQLNAIGSAELYDDHLFIDSSLNNDRQQLSQFQAADASYGGTGNSTEVTRFSVSPYLRWRLGNATNAVLRYRLDKSQSDTASATRQSESATLDLRNGSAFGRVGWGLSAAHTDNDSQSAEATSSDSYRGSLSYAVTPELSTTVFGGQEFQDFRGGRRQHSWNWGAGMQWQPDERTTIGAQTSKRFFGRGFNYTLSHRFQRSAIEFGYSRDLNEVSSSMNLGQAALLSNASVSRYISEYNAEMAALASSIPDVNARDRVVRDRLAQRGIRSYDLVGIDFASNQSVIDRRMRLAWVIHGARNSVTLAAHTSDRESISQVGIVQFGNDLNTHTRIKQRGWDTSWKHDLSALTSMGLRYAYSSTSGTTTTGTTTSTRSGTLGWNLNTKLSPQTTAGLSYNHIRSTGSADYRENAVAVQLNHRF